MHAGDSSSIFAWHPKEHLLAACSIDSRLSLFSLSRTSVAPHSLSTALAAPQHSWLTGSPLEFSRDGALLLICVGGDRWRLVETACGVTKRTIEGSRACLSPNGRSLLAFKPGGTPLVEIDIGTGAREHGACEDSCLPV